MITPVPEYKLLPCPFCGSRAEYERIGTSRVSCIITCTDCGCSLETGETFDSGHHWNKRVPDTTYQRALPK